MRKLVIILAMVITFAISGMAFAEYKQIVGQANIGDDSIVVKYESGDDGSKGSWIVEKNGKFLSKLFVSGGPVGIDVFVTQMRKTGYEVIVTQSSRYLEKFVVFTSGGGVYPFVIDSFNGCRAHPLIVSSGRNAFVYYKTDMPNWKANIATMPILPREMRISWNNLGNYFEIDNMLIDGKFTVYSSFDELPAKIDNTEMSIVKNVETYDNTPETPFYTEIRLDGRGSEWNGSGYTYYDNPVYGRIQFDRYMYGDKASGYAAGFATRSITVTGDQRKMVLSFTTSNNKTLVNGVRVGDDLGTVRAQMINTGHFILVEDDKSIIFASPVILYVVYKSQEKVARISVRPNAILSFNMYP